MSPNTSNATDLIDLDATREEYLAQMAEDLAQMADDLAEMERLAEARLRRQQSIDRSLATLKEIEQQMKGFDEEYKKVVSEEHFRRYREIADRGDPEALVKF